MEMYLVTYFYKSYKILFHSSVFNHAKTIPISNYFETMFFIFNFFNELNRKYISVEIVWVTLINNLNNVGCRIIVKKWASFLIIFENNENTIQTLRLFSLIINSR